MMDMSDEQIAKVCHQANKAYCESLGDTSQVNWEDAPEWQKKSCILGVHNIFIGEITEPGQSHESWLKLKEQEGWKYGPIKDAEKKEHPCFMAFDDLPSEQKIKDHLFFNIVCALGFED